MFRGELKTIAAMRARPWRALRIAIPGCTWKTCDQIAKILILGISRSTLTPGPAIALPLSGTEDSYCWTDYAIRVE